MMDLNRDTTESYYHRRPPMPDHEHGQFDKTNPKKVSASGWEPKGRWQAQVWGYLDDGQWHSLRGSMSEAALRMHRLGVLERKGRGLDIKYRRGDWKQLQKNILSNNGWRVDNA